MILIADDDRDTVETLGRLLELKGFQVLLCCDGNDALHLIEQYRPEFVLVDLAMPELSGYEVARELNEHVDLRPKLLIAVTGYGDDESRAKTKQVGFDHHLVKPINSDDLIRLLGERRLVEKRTAKLRPR